ncbi:GNAT family N-acetyltransferase [Terrimonas pollutisoli]|uniref:GNAT family N-acetyltransferase n=1 Tax=Terrimonas pollutisoli TaxID=3034147 RepID=UPI0023ECDC96|nr:GNAT family N-acetyltransferase [Terrimonas sp. H1YJ31]
MEEIQLKLNEKKHGGFYIVDGDEQLGEMEISVAGDKLTVYHTEVSPELEGKGFAKKLLATMVDYARKQALKVVPLCPYVNAQFKRHPDEYADIWSR